MSRLYEIKKNLNGWEFSSESALEDFIWDYLREIFNINPLRRQHCSNGNYCDILAVGENKNLIIIELKNTEDRYVIQQLTRYFHELMKEKPYANAVNYKMPIDLVVVAPRIHSDSIIDTLYSKLDFKLIRFYIAEEDGFYFIAVDAKHGTETKLPLPGFVRSEKSSRDINSPPKSLNTALSKCAKHDPNIIYEIRKKILNSDERMEEAQVKSGKFLYGKGKTKPYAEIFIYKYPVKDKAVYFPLISLWLPISIESHHKLDRVGQIIFTNSSIFLPNAEGESPLDQVLMRRPKGSRSAGESMSVNRYLWRFLGKELRQNTEYRNLLPYIEKYCGQKGWPNPAIDNASCLGFFMELALETWRKRLEK